MPFNGSGGTSQPASSIYPAVASTLIESAKFNITVADIYTMLASCIVKDGQTATTAAIPFASGVKTDDILENTAGEGVTIDSALIKDGRIDTTQGADIVCSATINLETATGNVVDVTGSTGPVTAITLSQGHWRWVRFTGTPTVTNGASLVLPGGADITAAAGDYALFIGYASSVVRCPMWLRANGAAVTTAPFSDSTAVVKGSSDATKLVRIEADGLTAGTTRVLTPPDTDTKLGPSVVAVGRNITASRASASTIDIDADELLLKDSSGGAFLASSVNLTVDITASGANGLDTGSEASGTWYYGWVIAQAGGTVAGLLSASATAPTMPAGYTFKALVTAARNDGSSNIIAYKQRGSQVFFDAEQSVLSDGNATSETAVSVATAVPAIAHSFTVNASDINGNSDGSGNWDVTLTLRHLSGSNYLVNRIRLTGMGIGNQIFAPSVSTCEMPNVSQQLYYLMTNTLVGSGALVDIGVTSFKLPVGGG